MASLDEASRRRPEFSADSVLIRLADGREWFFPKPWMAIRGRFQEGKPTGLFHCWSHGPEYDEAVRLIEQAETGDAAILATLTAGAFLLRTNYDLGDRDLEDLFVVRLGDDGIAPESLKMIREVAAVLMGTGGDQSFPGGNG